VGEPSRGTRQDGRPDSEVGVEDPVEMTEQAGGLGEEREGQGGIGDGEEDGEEEGFAASPVWRLPWFVERQSTFLAHLRKRGNRGVHEATDYYNRKPEDGPRRRRPAVGARMQP
jgi:hypothetical protein